MDGPIAPRSIASLEAELPPRVVRASLAGVLAALLMAALDSTIVETAMPRAVAEMNGFEHYAAVITVYLLAATAIVPVTGKLSDLYGRKPFLLTGVAIFIVGSALCGVATSMVQLVIFRGVQGLGAGVTQAMAFTTVADLYPPARRGRATGFMGAVFGLATVVGPAVGGLLTDGPGWRWCFYVNLPLGVAAFALLLIVFPRAPARDRVRAIDWTGAVLVLCSVVPILLALSWAGRDYAWRSPVIASLLILGVALGAVFLLVEARVEEPILPLTLFKSRVVWTAATAAMIMAVAMYGTILFIPLFLQAVVGRTATQSGAVLTPLLVSMIVSSVVAGQVLTRVGRYQMIAVFGMVVTLAGLVLLADMDEATSYPIVLRNMVVMGIGLGSTLPVFNIAAQNAVPADQVGVATSLIQFLRSMGGSIGAAVFGAILAIRFEHVLGQTVPPGLTVPEPSTILASLRQAQVSITSGALPVVDPWIATARHALALSLQDVFLSGAVLMIAGVVISALLKDIPLRQSNRPAAAPVPVVDRSA